MSIIRGAYVYSIEFVELDQIFVVGELVLRGDLFCYFIERLFVAIAHGYNLCIRMLYPSRNMFGLCYSADADYSDFQLL
jgi:hypothetical protein